MLGERMLGVVREVERRRCLAVAMRAGRGGVRWGPPLVAVGFRIGERKEAEGVGRPVDVRACVRAWRDGVVILRMSAVGLEVFR